MIRKGIIIFVAISLISFTSLFILNNSTESLTAISALQPKYILVVLLLVFFDWWIGAWRNTIFVRKVIPDAPQSICFNANLANIFMGAVTPSQTGGGPMHLYMLYRKGVKITDGIVLSIINFISSILFFVGSAGLALWYLQDSEINRPLYTLITSGFTLFSTLFTIIFIGLIAPNLISRMLDKFGSALSAISKKYDKKIKGFIEKIKLKLTEYNNTVTLFIRKHPWLLPYSLILTIIMYLNKYLIAYILVLALGMNADFWSVISIQAIIFFLLYFAPSPGGSGIAELSIAFLMGQFIPEAGIPFFTVLHRSFLLFLPAIVGAIIVLRELKNHSLE